MSWPWDLAVAVALIIVICLIASWPHRRRR